MSFAWQTTDEDVLAVIGKRDVVLADKHSHDSLMSAAEEILPLLTEDDLTSIVDAALTGDDMEDQSEAAHEKLKEILIDMGVISDKKD